MRRFAALLLVVLAAAGVAGCGDENKVGDKSLLDFKEQAQNRLGETTTTTAAPTTTTAAVTGTTLPAGASNGAKGVSPTTAITRPRAAATSTTATTAPRQQQQVATLEIAIHTDAPFFDPEYARVYVGSIVRWVNRDSVVRVVKADSGQFVSPPIPPGGSYDYKAITAGVFDYADETRPYVHATLEVIPV
jgi:plastocyanin